MNIINSSPLGSTFDPHFEADYPVAITTGKPGKTNEGISPEALYLRLPSSVLGIFNQSEINTFASQMESLLGEDITPEERKAGMMSIYETLWISLDTGFTKEQISRIVANLGRFQSDVIIPIEQVGDTRNYLLNESLGPTDAFKDIALQMLTEMVAIIVEEKNKNQVNLAKENKLEHEKEFTSWKNAEENGGKNIGDYYDAMGIERPKLTFIVTQTSTSGDTGPAAQDGILGKDFIVAVVGYPQNEATVGQRGQMQARSQNNVKAFPFTESFSAIQDRMKAAKPEDWDESMKGTISGELEELINEYGFEIAIDSGSFNSINPGRIDGQMSYHSHSLIQAKAKGLLDEKGEITEVVPSGNGGHVFGVLMARLMTGIQGDTIITCNENDLFYKIIEDGRFQKPDPNSAIDQPSVSMIIEYPNNMWRLFSYAFGDKRSNEIARDFMAGEEIVLTDDERSILKDKLRLSAVKVTGEEELEGIHSVFHKEGRLLCPHTANAYVGAQSISNETSTNTNKLISETASPWKFLAAVAAGISELPEDRTRMEVYNEYKELEKTADGCRDLIDMIKQVYQENGQEFSDDIIPENLREIYNDGFKEPEAKSAGNFNDDTLEFVEEFAPQFKRQVEQLLDNTSQI